MDDSDDEFGDFEDLETGAVHKATLGKSEAAEEEVKFS